VSGVLSLNELIADAGSLAMTAQPTPPPVTPEGSVTPLLEALEQAYLHNGNA
jgi:hypothetical protein